MEKISVKRGDTWLLQCVRTDENGDPVSLSGQSIAATIKGPEASADLSVVVTDAAAGAFDLSLDATATGALPLYPYRCDVEFTEGSNVQSTETFLVIATEDITNAA